MWRGILKTGSVIARDYSKPRRTFTRYQLLAIAATTIHFVKRDARFLRSAWARPVVLCGRHSLYVFCLGIVLSVLGHFLLAEFNDGIAISR